MSDEIKKCEECGEPMHRLDEGRRHRACEFRRVRKLLQKPLKDKITKLEASEARLKKLLEKLHWRADDSERGAIQFRCISCGNPKEWGDKPDCALAAELEGGE